MKTEFDKWKVAPSNKGNSYFKILGTTPGFKYRIAEVPFLSDKEPISLETFVSLKNESLKHAHLIAAAPELLEALQDCVNLLESSLINGGKYLAEYSNAKQAINKALGL